MRCYGHGLQMRSPRSTHTKQRRHSPSHRTINPALRGHSGMGLGPWRDRPGRLPLFSGWQTPKSPASPCGGRLLSLKEKTMPAGELEIHEIVLRMMREGYAALTAAQRRVVDALMAVC